MSIALLAIKFNHNPATADTDALNIRRNASQSIAVPEWIRSMTKPEDSLAAYSIRETTGKIVTIQAKFERLVPNITTVEVRAIQPPPHPPPKGWLAWLLQLLRKNLWLWHLLLFLLYWGFGKNVLGMVKPRKITFHPHGETDFETFELEKHWLQKRGVGIHIVKWWWQYRIKPTDPWTTFAHSAHKIYTVLEVPKPPWKQQPYPDSQNPWTDILNRACDWATFCNTSDRVANAITERVNRGLKLTYEAAKGDSMYTKGDKFLATHFISYLQTGAGLGNKVNCTDCATIVTTFANLLGCDLFASRMGWDFDLNSILAIGPIAIWTNCPFGVSGPSRFGYHEVAWTGTGGHNDPLYDACLKVDGGNLPWSAPHIELLPKKIPFSTLPVNVKVLPLAKLFTANSYRERLCANRNSGINRCQVIGPWPYSNNGRREVI